MGVRISRAIWSCAVVAVLFVLTGCVGIYDNTEMFLNDPPAGMSEVDVIKTYGTPAFISTTGDQKILTYKVRDAKYIVMIGLYDGYDLIVMMRNGSVEETFKVQVPKAFALFSPWNWIVTE